MPGEAVITPGVIEEGVLEGEVVALITLSGPMVVTPVNADGYAIVAVASGPPYYITVVPQTEYEGSAP